MTLNWLWRAQRLMCGHRMSISRAALSTMPDYKILWKSYVQNTHVLPYSHVFY